ncbi:hypothetical protein EV361DRAFT_865220 [Lentinula raphanica]|nr:hypothetical protein EV361DRAFT_865220 [Lentinula raphanica]
MFLATHSPIPSNDPVPRWFLFEKEPRVAKIKSEPIVSVAEVPHDSANNTVTLAAVQEPLMGKVKSLEPIITVTKGNAKDLPTVPDPNLSFRVARLHWDGDSQWNIRDGYSYALQHSDQRTHSEQKISTQLAGAVYRDPRYRVKCFVFPRGNYSYGNWDELKKSHKFDLRQLKWKEKPQPLQISNYCLNRKQDFLFQKKTPEGYKQYNSASWTDKAKDKGRAW